MRLVAVKSFLERIARRTFNYLIQYQNRYKSVAPYLGKSVLDIGCGSGALIPFLEKGSSYIGIDIREDRINRLKSRYPNHTFYRMDFDREPLPEAVTGSQFSSILLLSLIEHLQNPDFVLSQCHNLMNDTTRLIIITPTPVGDLVHRAFEKVWGDPIKDPYYCPHLRTYSRDAIYAMCKAHRLVCKYYRQFPWHRQFHLAIYARDSALVKE